MEPVSDLRIDKWLWAVRLYKTRSQAAEACRAGHVAVSGLPVKPSRTVRLNEVISARTGEILRTVKVLGFPPRRVGAAVVPQFFEDQTPAAEYLRVMQRRQEAAAVPRREKGTGRPTKKERRQLEALPSE